MEAQKSLANKTLATRTIRVMLVDDHADVRESLGTLLSLQDDIEVVGEAGNGFQAIEVARRVNPDVVLMDVGLPGRDGYRFDGLDACRQIKSEKLADAVIALTIRDDRTTQLRARQAGCNLFLDKGIFPQELLRQVRFVGEMAAIC
ncbi:MAG TPA: response regulator transcription factor [Chloroflexia bacterium]|nr:response regulator transcription factor [Chloroflexia bacterium]